MQAIHRTPLSAIQNGLAQSSAGQLNKQAGCGRKENIATSRGNNSLGPNVALQQQNFFSMNSVADSATFAANGSPRDDVLVINGELPIVFLK